MHEARRKRIAENRERISEALRKREEEEARKKSIREKISGTRWVRLPGAGNRFTAKTATGEEVEFEVTYEWFQENTGQDVRNALGGSFVQKKDGRWYADR